MKTYLIIFDNGRLYKMEAEDITEVSENLDYLCMSEMVITIIDTTKTKDLLVHILNSAIELDANEADAWEYESED